MSTWDSGTLSTILNYQVSSSSNICYVSKDGNDNNSGKTPLTSKLTVTAAIAAVNDCCTIIVGPGTYVESLNFTKNSLTILNSFNTQYIGTITFSGIAATWDKGYVFPTSGNAFNIAGDGCKLTNTNTLAGIIGFNITGTRTILENVIAVGYTSTGFNIQNFNTVINMAIAQGNEIDTRGFYFSNTSADNCLINKGISNGNPTAGFEIIPGCNYSTFNDCVSGGNDGAKIDGNTTNMWANFIDKLGQANHEHIYPRPGGLGVASDSIIINNSTTDGVGGLRSDLNYWGDIKVVMPKNTISEEFLLLGLYIDAITANDEQIWELFYTNGKMASQNGGNDWDLGETVITVDDASSFLSGDYIWITGDDRTDGEVMIIDSINNNAITISRETNAITGTGLRYDYDISPSNNKIYLIHRESDIVFHKIEGLFSAASTRQLEIFAFETPRTIPKNGAILMRMYNATDSGDTSFAVRLRYSE